MTVLSCKNYLQGGRKGDTEGNKTREKQYERTGRKEEENTQTFVKLNCSLIFHYVIRPWKTLQLCCKPANEQSERQNTVSRTKEEL